MSIASPRRVFAFAGLVFCAANARAQQGGSSGSTETAEVIRGLVRDSSGSPVNGVDITVTGLQSLSERETHTDANGSYSVLFGDGEGQYVVVARAMGFQPQGVRIERAPGSESPFLEADLTLPHVVTTLDSVVVHGAQQIGADSSGSIGSFQTDVTGGALFSLNPDDLRAMAARAPGVMVLSDSDGLGGRFSVLGAAPDQNRITVDGSTVISPQLPPGAIARATLVQTTYDPSQGNFAGGQLAVQTRGGNDHFEEDLRTQFSDPHLAWADPAAPTPINRNLSWNGTVSGPIIRHRAYFNIAGSSTMNTSPLLSVLSLTTMQRAQHGLSADTIQAVAHALQLLGVPRFGSGIPDQANSPSSSIFGRFDAEPTGTLALQVNLTANQSSQLGTGVGAMAFPSVSSGSSSHGSGVQFKGSALMLGLLDELHLGLQTTSSWNRPLVAMPQGTLRVGTEYADGHGGITQLDFGGGTSGANSSSMNEASVSDQVSWISATGHSHVQLGASADVISSESNNVQDPFGTYTYQSLADLVANQPASYTRTISSHALASRDVNSALWAGGSWDHDNRAFELQYGLRFDFSHPGTVPGYNALADSIFGIRTDRVPHAIGLTPRLGFTWRLRSPRPDDFGVVPITLSGGVGGFRGVIPSSRISGLTNETGLPDALRRLSCAGAATPGPTWPQYATGSASPATQCLDGTAPAEFSSSAPAVSVFDPSYQPPTSWRGNLQLAGFRVHDWPVRLNGTYSLGLNNESSVDLNLQRTPAFTLAAEGNRPVYVAPTAIVPATGSVAPAAARLAPAFASITAYRSDLRSVNTQLQADLSPPQLLFHVLTLDLNYSFNYGRAQARGFGGTTAGDPFTPVWVQSPQPVHQLRLNG
ncbi:MAG: TonB-dependent receptor, partial [Gemmatimonadaceae bacterium]